MPDRHELIPSKRIDEITDNVAVYFRLYMWRPGGHETRKSIRNAVELGVQAASLLIANNEASV